VRTGQKPEFDSPLLQMATTRGKTLELMVERLRPGQRTSADIGFTVGVMSLMDTLFSVQMSEILDSVNVLDEVRGALLTRHGDYGRLLTLIEHSERLQDGDPAALGRMLGDMQLSPAELYAIQVAAFEWVNGYTSGIH
jgi:EAL and modified HD-GYP domain-containing signal transduction protein